MAPKSSPFPFAISLMLAITLSLPAVAARAENLTAGDSALPSLEEFAQQMANGQHDQLRGVYAQDVFADSVVQQPAGEPGFVATDEGVLTQFSRAAQFGATGLLAHNFVDGAKFTDLQEGQVLYLVYGDGHTDAYIVTQQLTYQALQPNSEYSGFLDLESGERLSAFSLFSTVFNRPGSLILQTCIEADGVPTWGRLFVIAQPYGALRVSAADSWLPPHASATGTLPGLPRLAVPL